MIDRWKHLRQGLFRNVEPEVKLVAITKPVGEFADLCTTETLPAFTARASHESQGTPEDDLRLNGDLIELCHHVPLESVAMTFYVNGITKSLVGQWTRHRIGVGWTFRSTRHVSGDQNGFVYHPFDHIDNEEDVKYLLSEMEDSAKEAIARFERMRARTPKCRKEDARRIMPVHWNTSCYFYCNARSLRNTFILRLAKKAEWEIRRLHKIFFEVMMKETPSLFEDFTELARKEF